MASGYVILPGLTQTSTQCWSWRKQHKGLEGLFQFTGGDFNHRTLQLCFDGQSEGQGLNLEKSLDLRNHEITMRFRLSFGDLFINMQKWENDWLNIWNLARISARACDPVFFLSFLHQFSTWLPGEKLFDRSAWKLNIFFHIWSALPCVRSVCSEATFSFFPFNVIEQTIQRFVAIWDADAPVWYPVTGNVHFIFKDKVFETMNVLPRSNVWFINQLTHTDLTLEAAIFWLSSFWLWWIEYDYRTINVHFFSLCHS